MPETSASSAGDDQASHAVEKCPGLVNLARMPAPFLHVGRGKGARLHGSGNMTAKQQL